MGLLGRLNVKMGADTVDFHRAMDKTAAKSQQTMKRITGNIKKAGAIIGVALVAATAAFAVKMKKIIDDADELSKMSQKIGVSVQSLSAFRLAANLAGTSFETLTKGIGRFSRVISDASSGLITAKRPFQFLDIEIQNVDGSLRDVEDVLIDVAEKFSKLENGTKKAALAQELFGRAGVELIPFLNQGKKGLEEIRKEAEKLGIIFTTKTAKAAEDFNDNLTRLKAVSDGLFIAIGNDLIPVLVKLSEKMLEDSDGIKDFGKSLGIVADGFVKVVTGGKFVAAILNDIGLTAVASMKLLDVATSTQLFRKEGRADFVAYMTALQQEIKKGYAEANELVKLLNFNLDDDLSEAGAGAGKNFKGVSEEFRKLIAEGERLERSVRMPLEVLADEQERLNNLLEEGVISQETYTRAVDKAVSAYDKQNKTIKTSSSLMKDLGATFTSSAEEAVMAGEKMSNVLKGLLEDIQRIMLRKLILEPFFSSLFGESGLFSGGAAPNSSPPMSIGTTAFASGGIIDRPSLFPMGGGRRGLAGEAGIEGILPLTRVSGGDLGVKADMRGRVQVNIFAPPGSDVKEERKMEGGTETINILIDDATAGNIRPGTKTFTALQTNFGLGQQLTPR